MEFNRFGDWLNYQTYRNGPIGDIAIDYIAKNSEGIYCCLNYREYKSIRDHIIKFHNPCDSALIALQEAYLEYLKEVNIRKKTG